MNGNEFGRLFRMTTYGESHGDAMGVTISGCPAGVELSVEDVQAELDRRKPGQSMITTSRGEPDAVVVNSGVQDGYTTGTPIGMVVQNKDARSGKYEPYVTAPRPSHGDFTYSAKFGTRNWGGGGRSSARETVNWVAAGGVAKQVLEQSDHDVQIKAHVCQIGDVEAGRSPSRRRSNTARTTRFACDPEAAEEMRDVADQHQKEGDSIGGAIYFECRGVPSGLGAPRFDRFPSRLGQALYSMPAATASSSASAARPATTGHDRTENWEFDEEGDPRPSATTTAASRAASPPASLCTAN